MPSYCVCGIGLWVKLPDVVSFCRKLLSLDGFIIEETGGDNAFLYLHDRFLILSSLGKVSYSLT